MKLSLSRPNAVLATTLLLITAGMAAGIGSVAASTGTDETLDRAENVEPAPLAVQNETDNETVRAEDLTDDGNVTVVNTGENVTLGQIQGVSPEEPVIFVGPNATSGPNVTTGPNGTQWNVSQTYILGGEIDGWQGVAPDSINGTVNATLNLTGGQLYAITWVNLDAQPHNVVIEDQQGNQLARTDVVSNEGATQTLVFRTPSDGGTYYCEVHPDTMRGDIQVTMNATANATNST